MKMLKVITVLGLTLALAACDTAVADESSSGNGAAKQAVNESEGNSSNDKTSENAKAKVIKEEAAYVGQIDVNSIEVNTEFETFALQIGEVKNVDWSSIEQNALVIIEYYENEKGQHVLTSIEIK
jgi:hypothetical protein